jgi:hypothetical protein
MINRVPFLLGQSTGSAPGSEELLQSLFPISVDRHQGLPFVSERQRWAHCQWKLHEISEMSQIWALHRPSFGDNEPNLSCATVSGKSEHEMHF